MNKNLTLTEVISRLVSEEIPVYRYDKMDQVFFQLTKDSPISELYPGSAYSYCEDPLLKITPESALQKVLRPSNGSHKVVWQHEDTEDESVYNPLVDLNILINPRVTFYYRAFISNES